jgi:thioredoxin-related protein
MLHSHTCQLPDFPRQTTLFTLMVLGLISIILVGCERSLEPPSTEKPGGSSSTPQTAGEVTVTGIASEPAPATIAWYPGSIEEAFSHARRSGQPLFLYWGAVWCPPCEQIKQTVFKHPGFLALTRRFVPVFLDGDTERAQYWADRYVVSGYPTMVLFSPAGEELTRIPGGIETQSYIDVFQLALDSMQNTVELLQSALESPQALSAGEYTQLAFYDWDQANLPENLAIESDTYQRLANSARAVNNGLAASRLFFHSLAAVLNEQGASGTSLTAAEKKQTREELLKILANQEQVLANIDYAAFYAHDFIPLLTEAGESRRLLTTAWTEAMDRVRFLPALSTAEQLATWYPQLYMYWINDPQAERLPVATERAVLAHIDEVDKTTLGNARQTVINKVYQVLEAAHLYDESRTILLAELEKSHAPYYFMSGLASLEEELGNHAQAVVWLERAYNESTGSATRFQWGVEYVDGMTRLSPHASEPITRTAGMLLRELDDPRDVLTGRNFGRLQTLVSAVRIWEKAHPVDPQDRSVLAAFYGELRSLCQAVTAGSAESDHCQVIQKELSSG